MATPASHHEGLGALVAAGFSLGLPVEMSHWILHVLTSAFVGVVTWGITLLLKWVGRKLIRRK